MLWDEKSQKAHGTKTRKAMSDVVMRISNQSRNGILHARIVRCWRTDQNLATKDGLG